MTSGIESVGISEESTTTVVFTNPTEIEKYGLLQISHL